MPFTYTTPTKSVTDPFTTSATPLTEVDSMFLKPGARNLSAVLLQVLGRAAGATTLSGLAYRLKKWTTTPSSSGTAITPAPHDPGAQAATATAAAASGGVTSGTGGPIICAVAGSGVGGPGGWAARDADSAIVLQGSSTTSSLDLFVASGSASLSYEAAIDHQE
jgi:hypothetical protein